MQISLDGTIIETEGRMWWHVPCSYKCLLFPWKQSPWSAEAGCTATSCWLHTGREGERTALCQYLHCTNHRQVLLQLALLSLSFWLPLLCMAVWMPLQSLLTIHMELECTQYQRWSCCMWPFPATLLVSSFRDVITSHARFDVMVRGSRIWEKPGIVHTGCRLIPPAFLGSALTSASCLVWAVCFLNYPPTPPARGALIYV